MNDDTLSRSTYAAGSAELDYAIIVASVAGVQVAPLSPGTPVLLGRQSPATLLVNDPGLSRNHARFEVDGGEVWVEDLRSTNGTYINGTRIARAQILPHDEVTIGAITISLRVTPRLEHHDASGIESHDVFEMLLKHEVARALGFNRRVSVLMLRCEAPDVARFVATCTTLKRHLRMVDRVALYAPDTAEVLLPESDRAESASVAGTVLEQCMMVGMPLAHGLACYLDDASSADELMEAARLPLRKGSRLQTPVAPAPLDELRRLAETTAPALISGEIGTGKQVAARMLHDLSALRRGPFVAVRCGAIPEAHVESVLSGQAIAAQGGTLLIDEIADLSLASQVILLRLLDSGARIIATTKKKIEVLAIEGKIRRELVTRFHLMSLRLKPLRDRRDVIEPLTAHFLALANEDNACRVTQISGDAILALSSHDWPGNVRELRNVIERAVVVAQAGAITRAELPERFQSRGRLDGRLIAPPVLMLESSISSSMVPSVTDETDLRTMLQRFEVTIIEDALVRTNGNQSLAAELLGMPRRTLVHKLKSYEIVRRPGSSQSRSGAVMLGEDGRPLDFRTQLERYEESIIRRVLDACGGDIALAARRLGVTEQTLSKKVRSKSDAPAQ